MLYVPRRLRDVNFKVLRSVKPNAGVAAQYLRAIVELLRRMHEDVDKAIRETYVAEKPEMAQDATPANALRNAVVRLTQKWLAQFDTLSGRLADYFARDVADRSDVQLQRMLRQSGFAVNFSMTPAMTDVVDAVVHENVSLIKSIPQQYLTQVEGSVMRSVAAGRDLHSLSSELQDHFGVSKRRAALIARDQNNKATSMLTRVRQVELGFEEAIWQHSHAGKKPRPTHVKMNGKKYDIKQGMWDADEGRYVLPGELINCRCTSRPVVPGL